MTSSTDFIKQTFTNALFDAIKRKNINDVVECIKAGASVNEKNMDGDTPLHIACIRNYKEIASDLIKACANVNEKYMDGSTPLHIACLCNAKEIVSELIKSGAHVNEKNKYGSTPLHLACCNNYNEIASDLIKAGANVNEKNNYGETPLTLATRFGYNELVSLISEAIVNQDKVNDSNVDKTSAESLFVYYHGKSAVDNVFRIETGQSIREAIDQKQNVIIDLNQHEYNELKRMFTIEPTECGFMIKLFN